MKTYFIIIIFVLSSHSFATQVAFVFNKNLCGAEACLHGHFKKGQAVTLLSKSSDTICSATTGESFTAKDEMLKFRATRLSNLKGCTSLSDTFLAVFNTKVTYAIPKVSALDVAKLAATDEKIKKSSAFANLYKTAHVQNFQKKVGDTYALFNFAHLKKSAPAGVRYTLADGNILDLVWHKFGTGGSADGAIFSVYSDKVFQVAGLFKLDEPFVFLLNKKIYVLSVKTCQLGCGEITDQIFKLSEDGAVKIISNSDFST